MNKKAEKIITFIVLLWLVYGIFNLDSSDVWSLEKNWFSFSGFLVFIIYLIYSVQKAAKNNPE